MMFEPNWVSPPGKTIVRMAHVNNIELGDIGERLGLEVNELNSLIKGSLRISHDIAKGLSEELGSTPAFWKKRDEEYLVNLKRIKKISNTSELSEWAHFFPIHSMQRLGWIKKHSKGEKLSEELLDFFGCLNLKEWNQRYTDGFGEVAFRKSFAFENDQYATIAWLREGERQLSKLKLPAFNSQAFKEKIPKLKKLSFLKRPDIFLPKLVSECEKLGVGVVSSRAPEGCRASGATWTTKHGNPVIILSFRYLSEDHLWFTFFHEVGHIMHERVHINLDVSDPSPFESEKKETEADKFANDVLIPMEFRDEFKNLPRNRHAIIKFSKKINVTSGVIVGQLQKFGKFRQNQMNFLKRRYRWKENTLIPELI